MTTTRPMCRSRHITVLREQLRDHWAATATPEKIRARIAQAEADVADLQAEITWLESLPAADTP
jgi:hypothetical protein